MKIECDKCSAKYSIADEKVRGKTFKIRCKKCSNVIIVRDKAAAAAAGGGGGGAEPAVDQTATGWHLAINGETVGPMPEDEVRQRYDAGEIDKDTAIWQEGFEDWIPLGDVQTFADLPDQPAGGGDDPFASANQDDYAAAGVGAAAAAMGGAAAAAELAANDHEAQSPRVSSLTGQRNENSVLFSLDSLQSIATSGAASSGPAAAAAPAPAAARPAPSASARGLATAAPGSEGSGLIDIRALGAMVGSEGGGAAAPAMGGPHGGAPDDAALPSFGGAGLGGLASAPLVPQTAEPAAAAAAAAAPPPARSNAPIYVMMGVLILIVVGLGAFILLRQTEPVIVEKTVQAAPPTVAGAGGDEDKDKDKDKDEDEDEDEDEDKDKDEDEDEGGDEAGDEASGASKGTSKSSSKGSRKGSRKGTKSSSKSSSSSGLPDIPSSTSSSSSSSSSSKASKGSDDVDVDCILDPSKCGKGGGSKSKPKKAAGATDPNLPEKLSTTDIKAGIAPLKSSAKSCGGKHKAKPGTKVKVKISISGKTGTVTSAAAQAPHNGTPLGNCVAAALKKAKFKKFRKPSLGAVYPISL